MERAGICQIWQIRTGPAHFWLGRAWGGEIQIAGEWATDVSGGKPRKGTGRHRPFDQIKIDGPRLSFAAGLGFPNPNVGRKNGEGSPRAHQH
jgi:hypothetical protein